MKRRALWIAAALLVAGSFPAAAQHMAGRSRAGTPACTPPACWTGNFYQYEIVAQTGESVQVGSTNATLSGFGISPSINEFGTVALVGQVSDTSGNPLGDTLFFGDPGSTSLTAVAPSFLSTSRTFDDAVQINDANQLVAQDRVSGSPPSTFVRVWDGGNPDHFTLVAEGPGSSRNKFEAVLTNATTNFSNEVAFIALDKQFNSLLVESDAPYSQYNQVPLTAPLRPMMADDGSVVVRAGNSNTSPIVLYSKNLKSPLTIADTSEFSALGQSPGVSRDGAVVAFAGDLIAPGGWDGDAGPGIFVAIIEKGAIKYKMRIAGFHFGGNDGIKEMAAECVGGSGANCKGGRYFVDEGSPWCDPADAICLPGAELEDLPPFKKPVPAYFKTFTEAGFQGSTEWESRIAVSHADFGIQGTDGDSIVVSFVATPNMDDSTGLRLFSANQGIWTVRADLFVTTGFGFFAHVYRPIPVVQVGDTLGSMGVTVTGVAVYDQLANAAPERANGDHALGFWVSTSNSGQAIVRSSYIQQYGGSGWNANDCCGVPGKGAGTLGSLVKDSSGTNLILSNDHVMGIPLSPKMNGANAGDPITEPGPADYACQMPHVVGLFSAAPTLNTGVDAALATLNTDEVNTTGQIYGIGIPASTIAKPKVGMRVAKQGLSSGLTCGKITVVHAKFPKIPYHLCTGKSFNAGFGGQVVIESGDRNHPFDLGGDSGSLIVRQATAQPVALLFAGGVDNVNKQEATIANPIAAVASQLGITFVGGPEHSIKSCHGQPETMLSDEETERVRVVESKYEAGLLRDPAVLGIGVGAADDNPAEGVVVVMVRSGRQRRSIPSRLDGIRTEVILSDRIKPLGECSRGGGKVYDHTQTKSR